MLRTCAVRLPDSKLTSSTRSFQVPEGLRRWPARPACRRCPSRGPRATRPTRRRAAADHGVHGRRAGGTRPAAAGRPCGTACPREVAVATRVRMRVASPAAGHRFDQRVDRVHRRRPGTRGGPERRALGGLPSPRPTRATRSTSRTSASFCSTSALNARVSSPITPSSAPLVGSRTEKSPFGPPLGSRLAANANAPRSARHGCRIGSADAGVCARDEQISLPGAACGCVPCGATPLSCAVVLLISRGQGQPSERIARVRRS